MDSSTFMTVLHCFFGHCSWGGGNCIKMASTACDGVVICWHAISNSAEVCHPQPSSLAWLYDALQPGFKGFIASSTCCLTLANWMDIQAVSWHPPLVCLMISHNTCTCPLNTSDASDEKRGVKNGGGGVS